MADRSVYAGIAGAADVVGQIGREKATRRMQLEDRQSEREWEMYKQRVADLRARNLARFESNLRMEEKRKSIPLAAQAEEARARIAAKYQPMETMTEPGGGVLQRREGATEWEPSMVKEKSAHEYDKMPDEQPIRGLLDVRRRQARAAPKGTAAQAPTDARMIEYMVGNGVASDRNQAFAMLQTAKQNPYQAQSLAAKMAQAQATYEQQMGGTTEGGEPRSPEQLYRIFLGIITGQAPAPGPEKAERAPARLEDPLGIR